MSINPEAVSQFLGMKVDEMADKLQIYEQKLAKAIDIKEDAALSRQLDASLKMRSRTTQELKKKGKPVLQRVKRAEKAEKPEEEAPVEEGAEVREVGMKGEVKSEEETKKELLAKFEETGKKDAELNHIQNAESFIKKLHSGVAYEEIISSLIGSKFGSYPNRPDEAQKEAIKRADKILDEIIKDPRTHIELKLTSKEAKEVKEKIPDFIKAFWSHTELDRHSPLFGQPTSRAVAYRVKLEDDYAAKNPTFKLEEAIKTLSTLSESQAHIQFCLRYTKDELVPLFTVFGREKGDFVNSEGDHISNAYLRDIIEVLRNNTGFKQVYVIIDKELATWMKEWYKKIGPAEIG